MATSDRPRRASTAPRASRGAEAKPSLSAKARPSQQRSEQTFERLLTVAAEVLADVGVERLSTNLVCERAGLTPPALYRYFPNKYAILMALGHRLMARQDALIDKWISIEVLAGGAEAVQPALRGLLLEMTALTRDTVGGMWIMRAIRALPVLQEVRLQSHAQVTAAQADLLLQSVPVLPREDVVLALRVVANLMHATVEMLLEEPCDHEQVADIVSGMMASHLNRLVAQVMAQLGAAG
ncbi:MAG: hypothetical protein RI907_635 [Pseudomonadota bacterium]|jgi:AcrR family transcriptional regulator